MRRCAASPAVRPVAGYTLVELLVVVAIIAILVGIVVGVAGYASRKSATARAVTDLETIKSAIEEYRLERGSYPSANTDTGSLSAVTSTFSNNVGRYVASGFRVVDPWGQGYIYEGKGGRPFMGYRVYSRGPNSTVTATYDDIDSASGSY